MSLNEYAKMAFRLLDEVNQAICDGRDVEDIPEIRIRITACVQGLHTQIRTHDNMAQAEHLPDRYSKMCVARPVEQADAAIEAFFTEVKAARIRHQLADVHVVTRANVEQMDGEAPAMAYAHFGAIQEAEGMCAWAFGRATEQRRAYILRVRMQGIKAAQE